MIEQSVLSKNNTSNNEITSSQNWQPHFVNYDNMESFNLSRTETLVKITYTAETPEKELVNFQNKFYSADHWNLLSSTKSNSNQIPINTLEVTNIAGKKRFILYTYKIGEQFSATTYQVKLLQLKSKLTMRDFGGSVFIYSFESDKIPLSSAMARFSNYLKTTQE